MITPLLVISVTKNSVKIECVIIVICQVSFDALLTKSATTNTRFQISSQLYFNTSQSIIVTYLLKHWEIAKEIFLCISNNEENYISFTKQVIVNKFVNEEGKEVNVKRELSYIDCLRFMASSLDKLSSNLKIVNFKKYHSGNQLSLLLRKGVYPYDYVDWINKLDEKNLPPKEEFFRIVRILF